MSYFYMSNIKNFNQVATPDNAYQEIGIYGNNSPDIESASPNDGVISFIHNQVKEKASFLMIRAHESNGLLLQLYPYEYGVYVPAGELWSVDSLDKIEKIIVRNIFDTEGTPFTSDQKGKIQWMIGYK